MQIEEYNWRDYSAILSLYFTERTNHYKNSFAYSGAVL